VAGPLASEAPLTIVAVITARPGAEDALEARLRGLIAPSRADPGCERYDLHRSVEDPRVFLFYETWASRAAWEAHMETEHLAAFKADAETMVESVHIHQMEKLA